MKKIKIILGIYLMSFAYSSFAFTGNELYTGLQDWRARPSVDLVNASSKFGFVQGVAEATDGLYFCSPSSGVTQGQIADIVFLYLQNRPENRNQSASVLIVNALQSVYPCKKGK